jgi:hypothetical protein
MFFDRVLRTLLRKGWYPGVIATLKTQKSFVNWLEVENDLRKMTEDEIEQLCDDAETFAEGLQEAIYGPSNSDESSFNYSGPWVSNFVSAL